ncbi:MAG: 4-hydroxybenzoyl-CoA reductase subunit beta, partial [Halieaceae bacterium]|nr:4-hydroxybenzoyl-CoA reductase subunit beta [Halieaceae bacterium]
EAAQAAAGDDTSFIAGGTDMIPGLRRGLGEPQTLIDLSCVASLDQIEVSETALRVGAGVTLQQLISSPVIQADYKVIADAAETIAGTTHRHSATVGGNLCLDTRCQFYNQSQWWRSANNYCLKYRGDLCHVANNSKVCLAAYSGDLAPAMLLHNARVELVSAQGKRSIALSELYREDGANSLTLAPGELLVAVVLEKLNNYRCAYRKVRVRGGIDFPLVGVAMAVRGSESHLEDIRVAVTGTNSRPLVIQGTAELAAKAVDAGSLKVLQKLVRSQTKPMRSTFTPGPYRSKVVVNVVRRTLLDLLATTDC